MTSDLSMVHQHFGQPEMQAWLLANGAREDIIEWLVWNDGNGVYTDVDSQVEGYPPLTLENARDTMRAILERENDARIDGPTLSESKNWHKIPPDAVKY